MHLHADLQSDPSASVLNILSWDDENLLAVKQKVLELSRHTVFRVLPFVCNKITEYYLFLPHVQIHFLGDVGGWGGRSPLHICHEMSSSTTMEMWHQQTHVCIDQMSRKAAGVITLLEMLCYMVILALTLRVVWLTCSRWLRSIRVRSLHQGSSTRRRRTKTPHTDVIFIHPMYAKHMHHSLWRRGHRRRKKPPPSPAQRESSSDGSDLFPCPFARMIDVHA